MYQCGLPKEMALELFKPFVMKRLVDTNPTINIKSARKKVDRAEPEVWDALENVIQGQVVRTKYHILCRNCNRASV